MVFDSTLPTIHVHKETRRLITAIAEARSLKLADVVREALEEYIGSHNARITYKEPDGQVSER
jgi:hypothetical protein